MFGNDGEPTNYSKEEVVGRIRKMDRDVAGISALSTQYAYVKWLASELKKCNPSKIVLGSALATHSPEVVLRNTEADICVIGEGEETIKELLVNLDELENVKGICFKQDGEIVKNPPRESVCVKTASVICSVAVAYSSTKSLLGISFLAARDTAARVWSSSVHFTSISCWGDFRTLTLLPASR
jgi:radical SAM superfamily enzyme YgiQ (UPF0313 family)